MLQLQTAGYKALDHIRARGEYPPKWSHIDEVEQITDCFMEQFLAERLEVSKELGPGFLIAEMIDRVIRTDEIEHMDDETITGSERLESVRALDRMNRMTLSYAHQIDLLMPIIEEISHHRKEVGILELAAGSGGLALTLAEKAKEKNFDLRITASDIVPDMISEGNRLAAELNLPVNFRQLNAFSLEGIEPGSADLVLMSQSLHHFTPGQLALMIAQAKRHGASAFIGIDGYRSLLLTGGVPLVASLQGIGTFTLDGLTSARKFWSEIELDIIAGIATGRNNHQVSCSWPLTVLHIHLNESVRTD
jgi:hypothetical protein